ncbi:mutS protein homolog 5-like isoform X2 [Ptychodera flava]|uniref:mutS protein homolog 5-like isoform X2 n=1 Tax=Ptychodera flava TaxID=63121 RepID=UPI00396A8BAC
MSEQQDCNNSTGTVYSLNFSPKSQHFTPPASGFPDNTISSYLTVTDVEQKRQCQAESHTVENQVFLSVIWGGGKVGLAYYETDTCQVYMMMDIAESDDFQVTRSVIQQVMPACIITSSKQDEKLMRALSDQVTILQEAVDHVNNPTELQIIPSVDFSVEVSKRRILNLNLASIPQHYTEDQRLIYMSSLVPFELVNMVRAVGGLLKYLDKNRIGVQLEDSNIKVPIIDLKVFSLNNMVMVDYNTFTALQIFQKELHPSIYKFGNSGTKEGLSLYGIMNQTKSELGKRMLRMWFLRPSLDLDLLKERQDAIKFFVSPRNIEICTSLQDALRNIKNVARVLARMKTAQATIGDWQALYQTAFNAIYIGDLCRSLGGDISIFKKISRSFTEDLHYIAGLIIKIVDFEESTILNKFVVKPNVDKDLDEKKKTYNGLPDFMTKVAREELKKLSDEIQECNVVYLPQLGYLLAIPRSSIMKEKEDFHIQGLEFVFLSNNTAHYKTASTRDHETTIMHRLQNIILEHSKVLNAVLEYAAELDCLISLAMSAQANNYTQPILTTDNVIQIEGGRHPLQELCVNPFVPNNTLSGGDYGKVKFITGPNSSGKSIYIKQVGLIVFLAHIGSFVPAESSCIGLMNRIFTRIHSRESVTIGLSTFMIDLNQISLALKYADERSLVLLDEFGKGTETVDGIALLYGCLQHWLGEAYNCPHIMVSSHFHSILHQHMLTQSPLLKFQNMEVLEDKDEIISLYQLIDGQNDCSYALNIAKLAGLPKEVVVRAQEIWSLVQQNKEIQIPHSSSKDNQKKCFKAVLRQFLDLDFKKDDLTSFLQHFVIPLTKNM